MMMTTMKVMITIKTWSALWIRTKYWWSYWKEWWKQWWPGRRCEWELLPLGVRERPNLWWLAGQPRAPGDGHFLHHYQWSSSSSSSSSSIIFIISQWVVTIVIIVIVVIINHYHYHHHHGDNHDLTVSPALGSLASVQELMEKRETLVTSTCKDIMSHSHTKINVNDLVTSSY